MSEPGNETISEPRLPAANAPVSPTSPMTSTEPLPPPSGGVVEGIPAPQPNSIPLVDPNEPRLADAALARPVALDAIHEPVEITPPLTIGDTPALPTLPDVIPAPTPVTDRPSPAADVVTDDTETADIDETPSTDVDDEPEHPMGDLMQTTAAAREASKRAAAARAEIQAKTRRTKIIVVSIILAIAAVTGPFIGMWVIDAVNEAGGTSTEEP